MDQKAIEKVLKMFEQSLVASMELETDTFKIKLSKFPEAVPQAPTSVHTIANTSVPLTIEKPEPTLSDNLWVKSPLVGTFYLSSSPDAKPYVSVGQKVKEGQVVCLVEAMKVMNEIKAHRAGVVIDIKAENASLVEFNQALICIGDV